MFTRWALKLFTRMNQQPSLKSRKYFCFSYKFDSFVYYPGTYPKLFCVDSYQYVTTPLFDSKETIYFIVFLLMKSSHNIFYFSPAFYLIMWLMKALKKLKKIFILKLWELVSIWGVKTHFGLLPTLWLSSWSNLDFNILSTPKWTSGPQWKSVM